MFNMKKFALFLSEIRRKKNITQVQLAEEVGVTPQAVSKWERGESMPEISKLNDLANALELPVEEFIVAMNSDSDEKSNTENLDEQYYALPDKTLVGDVYALAPFLSRQTLTCALIEITLLKGSAVSSLLFKFADEAILRDVALAVFSVETDKGRLHLLPYLPQEELSKLILNRYSSGGISAIALLLPYSTDKEVVDMIFKATVSSAGSWEPLRKAISSIIPEVVVQNGIDFALKHGICSFNTWWSLIGQKNVANIFIGYCRHYSHSFSAWSDIAPYLNNADTNLMLEELERMKTDGYNFNMIVNPMQLRALPAPIRERLVEYGMKADDARVDNKSNPFSLSMDFLDKNGVFAEALREAFGEYFEELEDRIEELEARIDDLESSIDELE